MVTVDPLHVLTGPFGVALALLVGLGASWRVVRRLPADRRRRRVRIALAVVLLATLGWTWGRPDRLGPSRLLLGRHAWLEVRDTTDPATGATRRSPRVVGPNLVASVLESAVAVALVIGADLGIARRLASRDARHCPRCGYPRPDAGRAHAGRGDGGSGAILIDAADRRCPECGLALAARTAETAPSSPSS
jgi:ribosomal protein S27AE